MGKHVAQTFAAKGYRVALAARKAKEADNTTEQINVPTDLAEPDSVVKTFSEVKKLFDAVPSVSLYTMASRTTPELEDVVLILLKLVP